MKKILIMGLSGAGKTTLAKLLAARLNAVHFNADEVRDNVNRDLGFNETDRIEHARRMGWLCDRVIETGGYAIADLICPTPATRTAFFAGNRGLLVWVDRVKRSCFSDTDALFAGPDDCCDVRVTEEGAPEYWAEMIVRSVRPIFDPHAPTALFVGRYQPFHDGHRELIVKGIERFGQACIAVRDVPNGDKNPFDFEYVRARAEHSLREYVGRYVIMQVPNIAAILYGRNVGYLIERIELGDSLEAISATNERAKQAT